MYTCVCLCVHVITAGGGRRKGCGGEKMGSQRFGEARWDSIGEFDAQALHVPLQLNMAVGV